MVQIVKDQKLFLGLYLIFFIFAVVLWTFSNKGDIIIFFSENRMPEINYFFRFMSFIVEPWFFIVLGIIFVFIDYRNSILIGLVGISCLLLSYLLKMLFSQPRPNLYFEKLGIWGDLKIVDNYIAATGLTSFPSGHTMAAFALFFILTIIISRAYFSVFAILAAVLSGLSRIYLMNHFLEDVVVGSMIGLLIAISLKLLIERMNLPIYKPFNRINRA